jgi:exodeoxyribonuclease VII small subunit
MASTPSRATLPDVATLDYEAARDELVATVRQLESGGGTLEQSLADWERGEALARRCQDLLDQARTRLEAAQESPSNSDAASDAPLGGAGEVPA